MKILTTTPYFRIIKPLLLAVLLTQISCKMDTGYEDVPSLASAKLIPIPVSVNPTEGYFELTPKTEIHIANNSESLKEVARYLAELLRPSTGFDLPIITNDRSNSTNAIQLNVTGADFDGQFEAYSLDINPEGVIIAAPDAVGIFRGVQTLRQLLPATLELQQLEDRIWLLGCGSIKDYAQFEYRGAMLDVSRHFFSVNEVKRFIDLMVPYKMNVLHLHLSDDQGWRIEIKSWPRLTEHGGTLEVGGTRGGFFTQEDYKDIVNYASSKFITVVPEIDMPGHTNAALSSYPVLNCDGQSPSLYTGTDVGFSTLCTSKDSTYIFIDDVVRELAAITPGPYFHIGGDESHATQEEDYKDFIEKTQRIVTKYNKTMIGWDEIVNADIEESSIAQFWASEENAIKGAMQNNRLIMSPAKKAYMDMKYDSTTVLGLKWAGLIEIDTAYDWDPLQYVDNVSREDILGVEAPLWTETITDLEELEFMVYPRLLAYAEIGWSIPENRDWSNFKERLSHFSNRFDYNAVNYYKSPQINWH